MSHYEQETNIKNVAHQQFTTISTFHLRHRGNTWTKLKSLYFQNAGFHSYMLPVVQHLYSFLKALGQSYHVNEICVGVITSF